MGSNYLNIIFVFFINIIWVSFAVDLFNSIFVLVGRTWAQPAPNLILAMKVLFVASSVGDISFTGFHVPHIHSAIRICHLIFL